MKVEQFTEHLRSEGVGFYTGVPDSQLKPLCNYLMDTYKIGREHIIAANEGNCTAIAAGYHLATGKIPLVYMQNSGIGNMINPAASLLNDRVYGIPCVFVVGWRGEPGVPDEPQHIFQGQVTQTLLEDMDILSFILSPETTEEGLTAFLARGKERLAAGKSIAFLVKKGALSYEKAFVYQNENRMMREEIIRHIVNGSGDDILVSTTGKASRELFEIREGNRQSHQYDFLTVGSMGHCSSIALGIAMNVQKTVWCLDGDGAALMHMGGMAVIGANRPENLVHVVINNGAHETVGGMPTVAQRIDLCRIAAGCGYPQVFHADDFQELDAAVLAARQAKALTFIEASAAIGAREELGRPTIAPQENKRHFMQYLSTLH